MGEARWAVGIDLGTTHCVMAAARLDHPVVHRIDVPQLVAPGEVAARGCGSSGSAEPSVGSSPSAA